jgi:hypothetical protein
MTEITNETQFRETLKALSLSDQRAVGARFVEHVASMSDDERISFAIRVAGNKDAAVDELAAAYKSAKAAAMDCYTRCGADADWSEQAGYFVARAASAVVVPEKDVGSDGPAWAAAMNSRMARTCAIIDSDADAESQETGQQYRILEDYLKS